MNILALALIFLTLIHINAIRPVQCGDNEAANKPSTSSALDTSGHRGNGNKEYRLGNYFLAMSHYSRAIMKNASDPSLYTNRALCLIQLRSWELAADDCRRALNLDKQNVKANYLLGKVFLHFGQFDEAIKALMIAQLNDESQVYEEDISKMLRLARLEKFKHEEKEKITREIELQSHLNSLIEGDVKRQMKDLQVSNGKSGHAAKVIKAINERNKQQLNDMFAQLDQRRQKREIPDYLICKISLELLKDPVITPSGITYDRQNILTYLRTGAHVDPVSRAPLEENQLIPNLALKEALEQFVTENEWVHFADDL